MGEEERAAAYLVMLAEREAFYATLDAALAPPEAPFAALTDQWQPMIDYIQEGSDVGEADLPESEDRRFN